MHVPKGSRPKVLKNFKKKFLKDPPLFGKEHDNGLSVKDSLSTAYFISLYMRTCRGFQLRNWKHVLSVLIKQKCPKDTLTVIYNSWVTFKFARMIRPRLSSTYVYIMKNLSDLEGQKIYDDCFEQFTEQPYETTINFYNLRGKDTRYYRLAEYFYNEDSDWILPLTVFPRIDFDKSKMHYCMEPYEIDGDILKEVHEKVFNFIYKLDIDSIFMPRGGLLQKYGSQKYNDGGVVKFDYERPSNSFDSSFKYQKFLTQPLTPREVWLPGKAIKQNNAFMMSVHHQILVKSKIYPHIEVDRNRDVLLEHLKHGFWKFDISGFGFQYLRELLIAGNNAIRELYPCSEYEEQSEIFEQILQSVQVEMPDGDIIKPLRGIGLGYYEDLKTIVMLALLEQHFPIQIYGDQGLIEKQGIEFAFDLMKYQFIMNYEKVDEGSSEGRVRWGGYVYEKDGTYFKPRRLSNNIFGSFLSRHHWERKASLYSVYKHYPKEYKAIQKRLVTAYDRMFGYEFFEGDTKENFLSGGITCNPRSTGHRRLYNIRSFMTPVNMLVFDPIYQTPFNLIHKNGISFKESKKFQKKRKQVYKNNTVQDTILYDYINPVLEFNNKDRPLPRALPRWADLNSILFDNMTSGAITAGLKGDEIMNAVLHQHFSSDPYRARATGGYSIETRWRSERPPSQESLEVAELLMDCEGLDSLYVNRTDLVQNPQLQDDPMYFNTDLFRGIINKTGKRGISQVSENSECLAHRLYDDVRDCLPSLIKKNKINDFTSIIKFAKEKLDDYDKGYIMAESDHGQLDDDDLYYADAIDMIDLV